MFFLSTKFNCDNLMLYLVFAWFLGICYGFVLISSATRQNGDINLFETGNLFVYQLHSTVVLNEKKNGQKTVGFYILGDVLVQTLATQDGRKLIKLELRSPRLHIKSRKAPTPDGFIEHSSKLDSYQPNPFYIIWSNKGEIEKILFSQNEQISIANFKKGIASLFQLNILEMQRNESDASGHCTATYKSLDSSKIQKTKTNCLSKDLPYLKSEDKFFESIVESTRTLTFDINLENRYLQTIVSNERHEIMVAALEDLGGFVQTNQILSFIKKSTNKQQALNKQINELLVELRTQNYIEDNLLTKREEVDEEKSQTLSNAINNEIRESLKSANVGTLTPAKAFIRLIEIARRSSMDDVAKVLTSKKNQKVLTQIYDILGHAQTLQVHLGVMKKLHFDKEEHLEYGERYLWALSTTTTSNVEILNDLLKRYRQNSDFYPEKLRETLLLTIASMTQKLAYNQKMTSTVQELIINAFEYSQDEEVRLKFLRALKNLKADSTIPFLLKTVSNGTNKEGVLALKALKSLPLNYWKDEKIMRTALKTFLQLDRKYDSSARTLAVDILLESNPVEAVLKDVLNYLKSNETNFEIKQYVYQQIRRLADENLDFAKHVDALIKADPFLNNYWTLSPRGFSTALRRNFMRGTSINGSLLTVQEIFNSIAKRGVVNIILEKDGDDKEIFSLGIFSGGLSSFMSAGNGDDDDDTVIATAGMDLTILGTQIRPFVFFTGQGELMGHIWSDTAAEKTTAFQILSLLQDHLEFIRLGNGLILELNIKGALSFDISGSIQISIWNRNAESLVEKTAAIMVVGFMRIDSSFVRSQVEFRASIEPKLTIKSNIDFSSNMNMCMRVSQPDIIFKQNTFKIERIPGSKHKLRITKYKKILLPGLTYALNQKNNDMCNAMFNNY